MEQSTAKTLISVALDCSSVSSVIRSNTSTTDNEGIHPENDQEQPSSSCVLDDSNPEKLKNPSDLTVVNNLELEEDAHDSRKPTGKYNKTDASIEIVTPSAAPAVGVTIVEERTLDEGSISRKKRKSSNQNLEGAGRPKKKKKCLAPPVEPATESSLKVKLNFRRRQFAAVKANAEKISPQLMKCWEAVISDPSNFTYWTYLLQFIDHEDDFNSAREAYDLFLNHYPYCYGYWRKYAQYAERHVSKKESEKIYLKGLKAIPLSIDLWFNYLNFCVVNYANDSNFIRENFEKAIETCGLEFRSDRLWEFYIKWETDQRNLQQVFAVYDKLLRTPLRDSKVHFENFEMFVKSHTPEKFLSVSEFNSLRTETIQTACKKMSTSYVSANGNDDDDSFSLPVEEEIFLIRERIIAKRKQIFRVTSAEVSDRWYFEERIRRPYFHVKPLERRQLNNWEEYLNYEITCGNVLRTVVLFERCLISCALYEDFWLKYIKYLELVDDSTEMQRNVFQRACTIHLPKNVYFALLWSSFEEANGNVEEAAEILRYADAQTPRMLVTALRRVNLERRAKNFDEAKTLYETYIEQFKCNKYNWIVMCTKYARFCQKILKDQDKALKILKSVTERYQDEVWVHCQILDLISKIPGSIDSDYEEVFDKILKRGSICSDRKAYIAKMKLDYMDEFGSSVVSVSKAHNEYQKILEQRARNDCLR